MKSTIYIPTYKRRKNTIIDYIKQFPNVKFVVDIEDYNENYSDIPKEKCLIVPVEHRGCRIKRHDIINDAKKTNSTFFMIDDDISQRVRYCNGIKCYSIDLYEALEIHEKIHFENELDVSGGAVTSLITGHWEPRMKVGVCKEIMGIYCIDSTKIEPDWFTLDEELMDDVFFNLQLKLHNLKYLNLSQLFYSFKCTDGNNSLISNSVKKNCKKVINSFLQSNRLFDIRYVKTNKAFPIVIDNRYSYQYDKIKELYGNDKNVDKVIDYLNPSEECSLEDFFEK